MRHRIKEINEQLEAIRTLNMFFLDNSKGKLVKLDTLDLPNKSYKTTEPGIMSRFILSKADYIVDPHDKIYKPYLDQIDLSTNSVIVSYGIIGAKVDPHYHNEHEELIVVEGQIRDNISGRIISAGEKITFTRLTPHHIEFIEDSAVIARIYPPLKEIIN